MTIIVSLHQNWADSLSSWDHPFLICRDSSPPILFLVLGWGEAVRFRISSHPFPGPPPHPSPF